jgi:hypothetical protein
MYSITFKNARQTATAVMLLHEQRSSFIQIRTKIPEIVRARCENP